ARSSPLTLGDSVTQSIRIRFSVHTGRPRKGGATTSADRIMIYGPKDDGTYIVEFRTAAGESLAISIPRSEAAVIKHFQERMSHGLFVPDGATGAMRPFLFRVLVATFLFAAEHPQGPQIANAQE